MRPLKSLHPGTMLWDVASLRNLDRAAIHAALGSPHYVETDELRTFGGEEESWCFESSPGLYVIVDYRVPYRQAAMASNREIMTAELRAAFVHFQCELEVYQHGYLRR